MNCDEARTLVGKYADGECDDIEGRSIEQHLRSCADCAAQHEGVLALRTRMRAEVPWIDRSPANDCGTPLTSQSWVKAASSESPCHCGG